MNKATAEHYSGLSWAKSFAHNAKTATIKTEPLAVVLTRNAVPHDLDLMVVDVEGSEETVIRDLLGSAWRPRVLIVELSDMHPDFASNAELVSSPARLRANLISAGYREYYVDPINTIFVLTARQSLTT